jgi:membrane protein implicated in regulation of membrane protease activity
MNGRIYNWRMSTNPFVQVLWLIALGVVLIGAVLIGAVIVAFALGLALIASVVFYIRLWWLRRKFMRARAGQEGSADRQQRSSRDTRTDSRTIEVEYTIVDERDTRDRRDGDSRG